MTAFPIPPGNPAGTGPGLRVIRAQDTDTDTDDLARVIAEAFCDLPPSRWLIPDPAARREIFPAYFRLLVREALAAGVVHTTPERDAAALWLPAGPHPVPPDVSYMARLAAVTGWALSASYGAAAVIGLAWGLVLRHRKPRAYAAIGLGAHAATGQRTPVAAGGPA